MYSIFRRATYKALTTCELSGNVIDLGGRRSSDYHKLIKGSYQVVTIDIDPKSNPDVVADLEKPLAIEDAAYDGAIMMNVLEHIYHAPQLIAETARVLRSGGSVIVVVPFLFPIHPSPNDYFRFTAQALDKLFANGGFVDISIKPIGTGVFSVRHLMIGRLLPEPLSTLYETIYSWCAAIADQTFTWVAKKLGKQYSPIDYPLGYLLTAHKA